jgi:hypothetical protein
MWKKVERDERDNKIYERREKKRNSKTESNKMRKRRRKNQKNKMGDFCIQAPLNMLPSTFSPLTTLVQVFHSLLIENEKRKRERERERSMMRNEKVLGSNFESYFRNFLLTSSQSPPLIIISIVSNEPFRFIHQV